LYWLPLLRAFGVHQSRIVSLLFAREPLDQSRHHSGIIALTAAAADHARKIAPQARVAHLGWGADLSVFPRLPYAPDWFLSCGRTRRDPAVLCAASRQSSRHLRVVSSQLPPGLAWPGHVTLMTDKASADVVSYAELLHGLYASCTASLIVLLRDDAEATAVGMTNVIEAMAMARPVIVTRTGALPSEIDVEHVGCGLHVPPDDPGALAEAMDHIATHPAEAEQMGEKGRAWCERRYNIKRYGADLHRFFESL
jgi:glycosyltransferase involved in cell wall biosynthesis